MPILTTPRLLLRELTPDDAPFMLELVNEPAFRTHIGDKGVRTLDQAREHIRTRYQASYARHGFGLWAVVRREDAAPLGICGILRRPELDGPEIGYALLTRHTRRGYAREAIAATLAHARGPLRLTRLYALTALENPASIALLQEAGFREERILDLPGYSGPSRVFVSHPAPDSPPPPPPPARSVT